MSIADKLVTIAEKQHEVYDAGYEKGKAEGGGGKEPTIQPLEVYENGTYNPPSGVDGYAPVIVDVEIPAPVEPTIEPLTITENGIYTAPDGIDGYSPITVEVEGEGGSLIDPNWTSFQYFLAYGRATDEAVSKLKFSDTSNSTDFSNMFHSGTMTSVPQFDTSKGEKFSNMFYGCTNLTTMPFFDTSNGIVLQNFFHNCSALTSVPQIDTGNNTNFLSFFNGCSKLTSVHQLDTSSGTNFSYMFNGCNALTVIPALDTSKGTNFGNMFQNCARLVTIEEVNFSKMTSSNSVFAGCFALQNITFVGTIPINISFSASSLLTLDSLKSIITALLDVSGTSNAGKRTLTLHADSKALLEADTSTTENGLTWLAFAESKGWNIA